MESSTLTGGTGRARARTVRADEAESEQKKAAERRALTARTVHEALRSEGVSEIERPWTALAWSALAAGISMGLSLVAEGALRAHLPDTSWRPLVAGAGYSVGFIAVTLGRQQLFTESTLTACLPLLHEPTPAMLGRVLRLWLVLLLANLAGAWLFAWAAAQPSAFSPELRQAFAEIGLESVQHGPWSAFVRGVFGGWIIALMVWLLPSAESARPWIIFLMTWVLAAAGLTHIIAGSIEIFVGIASGMLDWPTYVWHYGFPVLAGNSIGGIVLVALLNHAQVVTERRQTVP